MHVEFINGTPFFQKRQKISATFSRCLHSNYSQVPRGQSIGAARATSRLANCTVTRPYRLVYTHYTAAVLRVLCQRFSGIARTLSGALGARINAACIGSCDHANNGWGEENIKYRGLLVRSLVVSFNFKNLRRECANIWHRSLIFVCRLCRNMAMFLALVSRKKN